MQLHDGWSQGVHVQELIQGLGSIWCQMTKVCKKFEVLHIQAFHNQGQKGVHAHPTHLLLESILICAVSGRG